MAKSTDKNTSRAILVIAGILVLSALAYFAIKYFSEKSANKENIATIDNLNSEILELEEKILNFEVAIEDRDMDLAEKDKQLEEKYKELEAVVNRLAQAKKTNKGNLAKIKQLESRVSELRTVVDQYRQEIDYLKVQNQQLTGQVDSLLVTEGRLKAQNLNLLEAKAATTQELEQTKQIASVLQSKDYRYFNVRKNGKEKEETVFRRGALNDLKICFTVMENLLAERGPKEVYLVYENPDGTINANFTDGFSGKFSHENAEKVYTAKVSINYNRLAQEVCIPYSPSETNKYQKGPQYVSIYCDGNIIGQDNFTIK